MKEKPVGSPDTPPEATLSTESAKSPSGLGYICGDGGKPYTVGKVSPTKRPGSLLANVIVWFGPIWIRFRIVRGKHGLFVAPPGSSCRGPYGRYFYKRCAHVDNEAVRKQLEADILEAHEKHLARKGRRPPKAPPQREPEPDRIKEALELAADHLDAPETGKLLFESLHGIATNPETSDRQRAKAIGMLVKVYCIDTDRLGHIVRGMTANKARA